MFGPRCFPFLPLAPPFAPDLVGELDYVIVSWFQEVLLHQQEAVGEKLRGLSKYIWH